MEAIVLSWGRQTFPVKGQIAKILSFMGCMVSVTTTHLPNYFIYGHQNLNGITLSHIIQ